MGNGSSSALWRKLFDQLVPPESRAGRERVPLPYLVATTLFVTSGYLLINPLVSQDYFPLFFGALTAIVFGWPFIDFRARRLRVPSLRFDALDLVMIALGVYVLLVGALVHEGRAVVAAKYAIYIAFFLLLRRVLLPRHGGRIFEAYALTAFILSALVVAQFFLVNSGVLSRNDWPVDIHTFLANRGDRSEWAYYNPGYLGFVTDDGVELFGFTVLRHSGYTTEPSIQAGFLLPAVIYFYARNRVLPFTITFGAFLVSFSLGGYAALAIALALASGLHSPNSRSLWMKTAAATVVGLVFVALLLNADSTYLSERLRSLSYTAGFGPRSFDRDPTLFGEWKSDEFEMFPSKFHLTVTLFRYGYVGLGLYLAFLALLAWKSYRLARIRTHETFFTVVLAAAVVIKFQFVSELFLPLFLLVVAHVVYVADERGPPPAARGARGNARPDASGSGIAEAGRAGAGLDASRLTSEAPAEKSR